MIKERKERIVEYMRDAAYKPLLFNELTVVLDVPADDQPLFKEILNELEVEGKVFKTNRDRYAVPERLNLIAGRVQGNERGYAFVIPDDEKIKDIFITADALNGAMHNDRVIVRTNKKITGDKRAEGEIIKVIERANRTIVGTFESNRYFGFVIPDNKRISADIFIPKDEINGAVPGQKVIAEILIWPEQRRNAEGRITEIIGSKDEAGTDILSIIKSYNLREEFPEEALRQAEAASETVTPDMLAGRRDLRKMRMVTIDGEDAKDLDDAVSIERIPDGFRLGVHIADVSYYVTENSPLDKESLKRGTSVYLVDRVIPMLPKKLSNGICSLNPGVDRLSFTVFMDIDLNGKIFSHEILESVINTSERMTYTNVYKILAEKDVDLCKRYDYLIEDFRAMEELSIILRQKRIERGSIDFDFEEAKIILDDKGKPVEIKRYEITIANKIIEEFMLACNETVAEHFFWANVPFVYRIHEEPDNEKITSFAEFAKNLGYPLKGINKIHPRALQILLDKVKGTTAERIISSVMLRSLQKAKYSRENYGHFGLSAKYYCHFTSPIRRYPDLIIHRIMKGYLKNGLDSEEEVKLNEKLPEVARQCSERERAANDAERETEDLKKVEYMQEHVGEEFDGIISSITSFGMFVELENTAEGLIRLSSLFDDYYEFNERNYSLTGERSGRTYKIGDTIRIRLAKADLSARQLDFVPVSGTIEVFSKKIKELYNKGGGNKTGQKPEIDRAKSGKSKKSGAYGKGRSVRKGRTAAECRAIDKGRTVAESRAVKKSTTSGESRKGRKSKKPTFQLRNDS